MRERQQQIDFGQCQRRLADAARLGGDGEAQLGEEAALDGHDLFLGVQHLGFVLFQLRRGKALGAHQRLLALVVGGARSRFALLISI